jgi:hypothetical protein
MDLFFIAEVSLNNSFEASLSAPSLLIGYSLKRFYTPACGWKAEAKMVNLIARRRLTQPGWDWSGQVLLHDAR